MVIRKKIIVLILLLTFIIMSFNFSVVSAEEITYNFGVDKNPNVVDVSYLGDNQTTNINNLYDSGYRSIVSRYSNQYINVKYNFSHFAMEYVYSPSALSNDSFYSFRDYVINNFKREIIQLSNFPNLAKNIDYSHLDWDVRFYQYSTAYSVYVDISGYFTFDLLLDNVQLSDKNNGSNFKNSSLFMPIADTLINSGGYIFKLSQVVTSSSGYNNYYIIYTLPEYINNVSKIYIFDEMFPYAADDYFLNNCSFSVNNSVYFNGDVYNYTSSKAPVTRNSFLISLKDNTRVKTIKYTHIKNNNNSSYVYTFNENYPMYLMFSTFTPLFANNSNYFIQQDTNNFDNLQLTYYEAEWYEIHKQLANGFIFIITELPIVSDVTNAIYSMFMYFKQSMNILTNFSSLGYIFAFGMFTIVFGILIKFIGGSTND